MKGEGIRDAFLQRFREIVTDTLEEHGPSAFKMPKIAAAAHESGHVVVGHSLGYRIKKSRLIEYSSGSDIWGGVTNHDQEPVGSSIAETLRALAALMSETRRCVWGYL